MSEITVDGTHVEISYYPDGSPRIVFDVDKSLRVIYEIVLRPKNLFSFTACIFFIESLLERNIRIFEIIFPYIMGGRQDRLTNEMGSDVLFTAKSMCKILNGLNSKILTFDPHSDVTSALLNSCEIKNQCDIFNEADWDIFDIRKYDGIISPDAGAEKKIDKIAKKFNINSVLYAYKNRDESTGHISRVSILRTKNLVHNGKYIVIDDICDGGSTFLQLADELMDRKIKADLYVTHGIFSKGTDDLLKKYNKIFCTDSILGEKPNVNVIRFFMSPGDENVIKY